MILRAKDISQKLADRVDAVVRYLLPHGKREGANWVVGGVSGEPGNSLGIQLTGAKAGVWADFATGSDKGDLLDLWAANRGLTLGRAIQEAKQWLGVADPISPVPAKVWSKPVARGVTRLNFVKKYLIETRQITEKVLDTYKVGEANGHEMAFPSIAPDGLGTLINVKYVSVNRTPDGKKMIRQEAGCAPSLFGWQAIPPESRTLIITEGQIDAMTWAVWGHPAVSVPDGVGNENWIDYEWDNLVQFDSIYLCYDMDRPGQDAVLRVAKRLGIHRCLIVALPHKDANECLLKGVDGEVAARCLMDARTLSPEEIKSPRDFLQEVLESFYPPEGQEAPGLKTPIFGSRFKFRPGEVTLWTGYTSHGKSSLLNQVLIHAMLRGERCALGSFEMKPRSNLQKMIKCITFDILPSPDRIKAANEWLCDKIWIYNVVGRITTTKLEELMVYSVARHGVSHIVLDSMMKCDIRTDDYDAQQVFLNFVCKFAIDHGIHIHIVAHPRKDKDDAHPPGIMDVNGGQAVVAQPDNIVVVWRNKGKEAQTEQGKTSHEADTLALVRKQRETGDEFPTKLWYHRQNNRFTAELDDDHKPIFPDLGIA